MRRVVRHASKCLIVSHVINQTISDPCHLLSKPKTCIIYLVDQGYRVDVLFNIRWWHWYISYVETVRLIKSQVFRWKKGLSSSVGLIQIREYRITFDFISLDRGVPVRG